MKRFFFLLLLAASCTSGSPPSAPVIAASAAPPARELPSAASPSCDHGFVEIIDGNDTVRYELGRELVPNERGAQHAFIEEVIHQSGEIVLHLEGLANADSYGGHLSLTIVQFTEPTSLPAVVDKGYAEYVAPTRKDERRLDAPRVEITRWGPEGSWIEGTFGPGSAPPVMSAVPLPRSSAPPRASGSAAPPPVMMRATVPYRGRFLVCRTKDWRVRL